MCQTRRSISKDRVGMVRKGRDSCTLHPIDVAASYSLLSFHSVLVVSLGFLWALKHGTSVCSSMLIPKSQNQKYEPVSLQCSENKGSFVPYAFSHFQHTRDDQHKSLYTQTQKHVHKDLKS